MNFMFPTQRRGKAWCVQGTTDALISVAGVGYGWLWGVEAKDVDRGQSMKDQSVMPQRTDVIFRVMGSHWRKWHNQTNCTIILEVSKTGYIWHHFPEEKAETYRKTVLCPAIQLISLKVRIIKKKKINVPSSPQYQKLNTNLSPALTTHLQSQVWSPPFYRGGIQSSERWNHLPKSIRSQLLLRLLSARGCGRH